MKPYYDPNFGGTEQYHAYPLGTARLTDSIVHFCNEKKAWWVVDMVASYSRILASYPFLVIHVDVDGDSAKFYVQEDAGEPLLASQDISYTDLDVSVKLYLIDGVLMFPSDY